MMPETLVALLCRHGQTNLNEKPVYRGWKNVPLDPKGVKEAKDAAKKAKKYPVKRIVASPLARTLMTAQCYAEVYGCEVEQEGALMPFHTGVFTGLDKDDNKDSYQLFMDNPEVEIPNGESVNQIHDRVGDYFDEQLKDGEKNLTLYVAHSSTAVILHNLLTGSAEMYPGLDEVVSPGGLVGIYTDGKGYKLKVLIDEESPSNHGS
jgi:broad specificity phosphatase PhoE